MFILISLIMSILSLYSLSTWFAKKHKKLSVSALGLSVGVAMIDVQCMSIVLWQLCVAKRPRRLIEVLRYRLWENYRCCCCCGG